jgi:hypothetical protein
LGLQTKRAISEPGDQLEQEADRVAEQVLRTPFPQDGPKKDATSEGPLIRRRVSESASGLTEAPPIVNDVLRSPGQPLDPATRAYFEARFGHDFSRVRVHSDPTAEQSARDVNALAYTVGQDIVFRTDRFAPGTPTGRRLIAHELTHVVQQARQYTGYAATGAHQVQRQKAPERADEAPAEEAPDVAAVLAQYEKSEGKRPPKWLERWARKYERARTEVPEAPPLHLMLLIHARDYRRIHGKEPPLPKQPQPIELAPGAVAANEILPFAKGSTLMVSHLLADVLEHFKSQILAFAAAKPSEPNSLASNASLILDLLTDPEVSRSVTATVTESSPVLFEARIAVPDVPAKDKRPAVAARQIAFSLEAVSPEPSYDLWLDWGNGRALVRDIKARRDPEGKVLVSVPVKELTIELGFIREPSGAVVAEIDHKWVRLVLSGQTLKLVRIERMTEAPGTPGAAEQQARMAEAARASGTFLPSGHAVTWGGGFQYAGVPSALYSLGWRFTYAVAGDVVGLPLQVQLDYAPRAGLFTGGVGYGVDVTPVSLGDVPVTFSLIPGLRGGAADLGVSGQAAAPVFGPSLVVGAALGITPRLQVRLSGEYFQNVLDEAAEKGVSSVGSVQLGSVVRF